MHEIVENIVFVLGSTMYFLSVLNISTTVPVHLEVVLVATKTITHPLIHP